MTMKEDITPSAQGIPTEESTKRQTRTRSNTSSRRTVLAKGLGVAAVTVGVGAALEMSSGTALASSVKPGVFASNVAGTPAAKATGTNGADGVQASSDSGIGVSGTATGTGTGVQGASANGIGVQGDSSNIGVAGTSTVGIAVQGSSANGIGVQGISTAIGVQGIGVVLAGEFRGNVFIDGDLGVSGNVAKGSGSFRIDHPLDPAHKYLLHSFVESPDMKNIYDGVVALDANGEAEIVLPPWFDALNTEFRYQLTAIGASGPDLYIAEEVRANRFKIAGGKAGMKVSWQVTGIRQDLWANAHRIPVEQDKPLEEQGRYLHPELYGLSEHALVGRT